MFSSISELERGLGLEERIDERVDIVLFIVDGETGAAASDETELGHERHGAVVSAADCDALAIEERGEIVRMRAIDDEGDRADTLPRRRSDDLHARNAGELLERVRRERTVVRCDGLHADGHQPFKRGAEPDDGPSNVYMSIGPTVAGILAGQWGDAAGGVSGGGSGGGSSSIGYFVEYQVSAVPLPAALPLMLTGLAGFGVLGWRRKRAAGRTVTE